ncbi:hypothetical protein B0A52_03187 [Exophiala mesophila]|uniref:Clr5 domain-containing protein n=1 Tax=Exophiala mesophila TaxID=212818 RepID=A0A438NAN1_EXOME|nr:hypothetical protein B0A52_03187 [Exophiala mesophila]
MSDDSPVERRGSDDTSSSSNATPGTTRRQSHALTTWARHRPTIEHFYINLDMPLRDVVKKMEEDYDFHATENMYKKRFRGWKLAKHIKAEEKEMVLANLLHNTSSTAESGHIRHDKLVRYAKSRARSGDLDSHDLERIVHRDQQPGNSRSIIRIPAVKCKVSGFGRHSGPHRTEKPSTIFLPRSPAPPDELDSFDRFLRAMQMLIVRERQEYLTGLQQSPDVIFTSLSNGLAYWRGDAYPAARKSFGWAARKLTEDIRGSDVFVSRITFCISSIIWGGRREEVFQKFSEFMAKVALEVLGPMSPLTIVLQHLQTEQSLDAQVAIWACALDDYQVTNENLEHWWNMAQRRWRWCRRSGKVDLAERYCRRATNQVREVNLLTSEMESEAQQDLDGMASQS